MKWRGCGIRGSRKLRNRKRSYCSRRLVGAKVVVFKRDVLVFGGVYLEFKVVVSDLDMWVFGNEKNKDKGFFFLS